MNATLPPLFPYERWLRAGVAVVLVGGLTFLAFVEPRGQAPFPHLPCGVRMTTGLPCPLCGGTRAAHAALQGDTARALDLNPLAFPALALTILITTILLFEAAAGRRFTAWARRLRHAGRFAPVLILLVVAWWIPHAIVAVLKPKPELVDLRNPIAASLKRTLEKSSGELEQTNRF